MMITTPGVLMLNRKQLGYILTFEKQGYKPVEISLQRRVDGWVFGNILMGGLIGIIVDFSTGAAYRLTPEEVNVVLGELGASLKDKKGADLLVAVDLERLPKGMRTRIARQRRGDQVK
jgi:hypothetical protein